MPDFTEAQVFEALGLGEKAQEAAAPAPETSGESEQTTGAKEQEAAAPAGEDTTPATETTEETTAAESGQEPETPAGETEEPAAGADKAAQTMEERREHAAQRRQRETQAAIDAAVQEALKAERDRSQAEMDAFFAQANLKNTITGEAITNMQQFQEWRSAFDAAKLQRDLKAGKLTPESLQKAIDQTPAMQKVQQMVAQQDEARRQQDMAAAQAKVDAELKEIQKLDPTIKEVKDLLTQPYSKQFYEYVKKGNSFLDAFYLANRERLEKATAEAARQQAMNNARSKDHLSPTAARGGGAASVPAEELAMYREFMPGATDAEIQAHYNKYKNG